ncbi:MAG: hypothetical protein M1371_00995 [Actinobacteria bacterium]|nr:hypothetical protein [Actinomycetota bacterium]
MTKNSIQLPRAGLLLFEAQWFIDLKIGDKNGTIGDLGAQLEKEIARIEETLHGKVNLTNPGIVFDINGCAKAIELFKKEKVDCIIACFLTWAEDKAWIKFLVENGDIPLLYWGYTTGFFTTKQMTPLELYHNSGVVGTLQGSGSLKRFGRKFKFVLGSPSDEAVIQEIVRFANTARVVKKINQSAIGLLPFRNDQMKATCVDEYLLLKKIGARMQFLTLAELKEEGNRITEKQINDFIDENRRKYNISPDMRERDFREAARYSLAMSNMYVRYGLDALAINDVCDELHRTIGLRPCLYPEIYHEINAVIGLEGDVLCTLAMLILNLLTGNPVGFTEIFNFNPKETTVNAGHPGPVNPRIADREVDITIVPDLEYMDGPYEFPYSAAFELIGAPGRITMINILDIGENLQMIVSSGESIGRHLRITGFPHYCIRTDIPVEKYIEKIVLAGCTQHFAVVHGDMRKEAALLAELMSIEFITV